MLEELMLQNSRFVSNKGFTLVELLIAIVIIGILAAIGVPSFQALMDKKRLQGAVDNVLADLRYVQSESVKQNRDISVTFTEGSSWAYSFSPVLSVGVTASGGNYRGTSMVVSATDKVITFEAKRSTISQGDTTKTAIGASLKVVELTSANGLKLGIEIDAGSRMGICTASAVAGYPSCP